MLVLFVLFKAWWNAWDTAQWHADAGSEMLDMLHMVRDRAWLQLGAPSSTGGYRLPPFFYLLLIPSAILANWNPLGPILFGATLNVLALPLLYAAVHKVTRRYSSALMATYVLGLSTALMPLFRSMWSVYPGLFFMALFLYGGTHLDIGKFKATLALAISTAALWSFHTFLFFTLPMGLLFFAYSIRKSTKRFQHAAVFVSTIVGINLTLILAEFHRHFANLHGFVHDLNHTQKASLNYFNHIGPFWQLTVRFFLQFLWPKAVGNRVYQLSSVLLVLAIGCVLVYVSKKLYAKNMARDVAFVILFFMIGFLELFAYKGPWAGWYFIPLWLLPPVLCGVSVGFLCHLAGANRRRQWSLLIALCLALCIQALVNINQTRVAYLIRTSNLSYATRYLSDVASLTHWIEEDARGKPFAFYNSEYPSNPSDYTFFFIRDHSLYQNTASVLYLLIGSKTPDNESIKWIACVQHPPAFQFRDFAIYRLTAPQCLHIALSK